MRAGLCHDGYHTELTEMDDREGCLTNRPKVTRDKSTRTLAPTKAKDIRSGCGPTPFDEEREGGTVPALNHGIHDTSMVEALLTLESGRG